MSELRINEHDGITTLTLNRPAVLNALSPSLLRALMEACDSLSRDESIRVVVIRGAGRSFSAGADLPGFESAFAAGDEDAADLGRRATEAVWHLPQITIAAVHGHCVGGAIVLAACCDLRIAAADSRFSIPEVDAGIPLAWGGMAHLCRLVGEATATDLVLSCRPFGADSALSAGFLTGLVAPDAFDDEISSLARETASRPGIVLRTVKQQLTALRDGTFEPRADAAALLAARQDPEARAIGAEYLARRFRDKRAPESSKD
ncbi:MAG: enoyl-CoA hydratase/isomerase family protein [Pseudomonadota bacterium]